MKVVAEILDNKGRNVWTTAPADSVYDALSKMAEYNVGALVVMNDKQVAGIISERDYARNVIMQGKSSLEASVEDIMATNPRCVSLETTIAECMDIMTDRHVRHLPVLEGIALVGLVSIGDVVKTIISECESKVEELESYIYGP